MKIDFDFSLHAHYPTLKLWFSFCLFVCMFCSLRQFWSILLKNRRRRRRKK